MQEIFNSYSLSDTPEQYQNKLFNAAQFINHKGEVLANHRKSMLPLSSKENLVFDRGSKQTLIT